MEDEEEEDTKKKEDEAPAEEPEPPAEEPEPPAEEPEPPPEEREPEQPEPPPDEPPKEEPPYEPSALDEPFEDLANSLSKPVEAKSLSQSPTIQDSSFKDEFIKSEITEPDKTENSDTTGGFKAAPKLTTDYENAPRKVFSKKTTGLTGEGGGVVIPGFGNFSCSAFLSKRSPFIHNPPYPEERRERVRNPRTPKEYIINLREDLADFQETHGLPRTRDYSFMSLGLALAQETARAICSLILMFAELFPILAIVSLIMRFALDKLIEILETDEPVPKLKKSVIFALQLLVIIIPLWILIGTIIIPLISLVLSIFKRIIRFKGSGKRCSGKPKCKSKVKPSPSIALSRLFY